METRTLQSKIRNVDEEKREATFVASNSTKDRHGTVVNQSGWSLDNYRANPIIGYQHNVYGNDMCEKATPDDIIGRASDIWQEGDDLMLKITFKPEGRSELADKVFMDVRDGFLNTVSVGFIETGEGRYGDGEEARGAKNQTYYFEGQELLEVSVVNIPSNPKALKKSFRDSTFNAINYLMKAFDHKHSFSEIEAMTVGDIIKKLSHDDKTEHDNVQPDIEEDTKERKLQLYKYKLLLAQI